MTAAVLMDHCPACTHSNAVGLLVTPLTGQTSRRQPTRGERAAHTMHVVPLHARGGRLTARRWRPRCMPAAYSNTDQLAAVQGTAQCDNAASKRSRDPTWPSLAVHHSSTQRYHPAPHCTRCCISSHTRYSATAAKQCWARLDATCSFRLLNSSLCALPLAPLLPTASTTCCLFRLVRPLLLLSCYRRDV